MMREDKGFIRLFEGEIEKVNTFFVDKEEDYIIKLKVFFYILPMVLHLLR